jgi:hypothetical protein
LKEPWPIRWPHVDDVIVRLHLDGENVWQASARAARISGATSDYGALFSELWETGRILLASGGTSELPQLTDAGVATICQYELDCADYEADRVLVEEPISPMPRIASEELWPALSRNDYKVGRSPTGWRDEFTPPARLAELTGIPEHMIRSILSGALKTVDPRVAIAILSSLDDDLARDIENQYASWLDVSDVIAAEGLEHEYLDNLARFAQMARVSAALTTRERQSLDDIIWISVAAQRKSFLGTTAAARLAETRAAFRAVHGREPVRLTRRLQGRSRRFFRREAAEAGARGRALRHRLHRQGAGITGNTVAVRTTRLRNKGRLPRRSRPRGYRPEGGGPGRR